MMVRLIDSPTPIPASLVVKNGWNRLARTASGRPWPVSATTISTMPSATGPLDTTSSRRGEFGHRLHRVAHQVDQHLLDLDAVGDDAVAGRVERESQLQALLARADQSQRRRLLDQLGDALDAPFGLAAQHEVAQAADDLAGADRLLGGAVERGLDLVGVRVGAVDEQPARALHVVADRRERLIELVGERRRHLAHRAQARDVGEFGLHPLEARLGALLLGEVAHETGEIAALAPLRLADREMHREGRTVGALAGDDAADADDARLAVGAIAGEIGIVAAAVGLRHQDAHVLADRLFLGDAEHPLGGAAEELDGSDRVDDDHRVGDGLEDRAQVFLAAAQRLLGAHLRVDVEHAAGEAPRRAGAGRRGEQAQPVRLSVATDAERDVEVVAGAAQRQR